MATDNPEDHDGECPVVTRDGPVWAPTKCRCEYLARQGDEYYAEPPDMFAREWDG